MASRRDREKREMRYSSAKDRASKHAKGFVINSIDVPKGVELFSFRKAGKYRLDILPYEVGDGNKFADEGMMHYERTYYTHNGIGPDSLKYCCLRKTFKKACPICEHINQLQKDGADWDTIKEMAPKERQLFNVIDLAEKEKGVQIFEFNYHQFGKILDAMMEDEEDNYDGFFHLDGGKTLKITVVEDSYAGRTFYKPTNIEMVSRADYDESIMEKVICLDGLPKEVDYDELKTVFLQSPSANGEEDEEEPKKKKKAKASDEDEEEEPEDEEVDDDEEAEEEPEEDDDEEEAKEKTAEDLGLEEGDMVFYKGLECEIIKVSGDGTSLTIKDDDGEVYKAIDPNDVEKPDVKDDDDEEPEDEEESEEEASDEDEEPEDDEDEDEEDEPTKKPRGRPGKKGK